MNVKSLNLTQKNPNEGFSLLELLMVIVFVGLIMGWGIPNIRRQIIRQEVNNYTLRIEAGLQSLRAKQAVEKTSCVMTYPGNAFTPSGTTSPSNFVGPAGVIELKGIEGEARKKHLNCSDDPTINNKFRLLVTEGSPLSKKIEISLTRQSFTITPPGTSTDGGSLILLIRSKQHATLNPPLPIRCVEFTGNGLSRVGDWDGGNCETR